MTMLTASESLAVLNEAANSVVLIQEKQMQKMASTLEALNESYASQLKWFSTTSGNDASNVFWNYCS